jgi:hypothetical protein
MALKIEVRLFHACNHRGRATKLYWADGYDERKEEKVLLLPDAFVAETLLKVLRRNVPTYKNGGFP